MLHDLHNANLSAIKIVQMNSAGTSNLILDKEVVKRKIKRMALEVAEQNTDAEELIIAGIIGHGMVLAKCIADELQKLAPVKTQLVTIHLNKKDPKILEHGPESR